MGNIMSVANIIKKTGGESVILSKPTELANFNGDKIILPGVGAFDQAISTLRKTGWSEELNHFVEDKNNKLLGICLGMQLMFNYSEEGEMRGLGWIDGHVEKFRHSDKSLKTPHMGWNDVLPVKESALFERRQVSDRFYFVHSYYVVCKNPVDIVATCNYGITFTCAVAQSNIYGVQFHPEKSHRFGKQLITKFISL